MHFREQENIFHFELCVKKSILVTLFNSDYFSSLFLSYYIISTWVKMLKWAMIGDFTVLDYLIKHILSSHCGNNANFVRNHFH